MKLNEKAGIIYPAERLTPGPVFDNDLFDRHKQPFHDVLWYMNALCGIGQSTAWTLESCQGPDWLEGKRLSFNAISGLYEESTMALRTGTARVVTDIGDVWKVDYVDRAEAETLTDWHTAKSIVINAAMDLADESDLDLEEWLPIAVM